MDITIQTVNLKVSKTLTNFVNAKVGKLFKQSPEIIRADVTLKEGAKTSLTNKWCAIYISHPGENEYVKKSSATYQESVLLATEAMEKILRRRKTKMVNMRNDDK
ncbi:MAG: HPF/RaiA family ribosome-associated protein [Chitinophagaceae bacterium]